MFFILLAWDRMLGNTRCAVFKSVFGWWRPLRVGTANQADEGV